MKYGTKKHVDFMTLLYESLLKSLWKTWKSWKKSIFCHYSKSDFFKSDFFNVEVMQFSFSCGICKSQIKGWKLVRGIKNFWFVKYKFSAFFCTQNQVKIFKISENISRWKFEKIEEKNFFIKKDWWKKFFLHFFRIFNERYFREF